MNSQAARRAYAPIQRQNVVAEPGSQAAEASEPLAGASQVLQAKDSRTGLPATLKAGVEKLSGISLAEVQVRYNSPQPAQLHALAFAKGTEIHVAPGQGKHLPHEAWHVVQQKQGRVRPTMQFQGTAINDDPELEQEADRMGARALQAGRYEEEAGSLEQLRSGSVVQRAMGMEVETRRKITSPAGEKIKGDIRILEHPYFTLVTDSFKGYSNLEFVMKHFNQLAGSEGDAIAELQRRIAAMKSLAEQLYAGEGRLGDVVANIGTGFGDIYTPARVEYNETPTKRIDFQSEESLIAGGPDRFEDGKLYVHYTVGFEPKHWFKMVKDIHARTRKDTSSSRAKTQAGHAITAAGLVLDKIDTSSLNDTEREELRGHLALLYMQMAVFIERTMDLEWNRLKKIFKGTKEKLEQDIHKAERRIAAIDIKIKRVDKDESLNIVQKDETLKKLRKSKRTLEKVVTGKNEILTRDRRKIKTIEKQLEFGKGQQKNKIAALPRATLSEMFAALSPKVQLVLQAKRESIVDTFAEHLESSVRLDLTENFELESPTREKATLIQYLNAGLGSGQRISQQVLFGGMREVGIDTSVMGKKLLPLEFRSIFDKRVTWDEMEAHAIKILKWSRDPETKDLT
ncbi:MAG TPA: DUF4157 domain-containing protein [Candidatus Angelobacter sp.]